MSAIGTEGLSVANEDEAAVGAQDAGCSSRCCKRYHSSLMHFIVFAFPFLLLGEHKDWKTLSREHNHNFMQQALRCLWIVFDRQVMRCKEFTLYFGLMVGWTLTSFAFLYVILATSAQTNIYFAGDDNPKLKHQAKLEPDIGADMATVAVIKQVILTAVIRELCLCMEPNKAMCRLRKVDCNLNQPQGFFSFFGWSKYYGNQWFTSFLADHVLLVVVGVPFVVYKLLLIVMHWQASKSGIARLQSDSTMVWMVCQSLLTVYVGILVGGFLIRTLGNFAVPKRGKELKFFILLSTTLALWAVEFLVISGERGRLFSTTFPVEGINRWPLVRVASAFAQIFVTHSSAMLGAVLMGHSAHFKRCPDLQWKTFWCGLVPWFLIFVVGHSLVVKYMTEGMLHPKCRPSQHLVAMAYPYIIYGIKFVCGSLLICAAVIHSQRNPLSSSSGVPEPEEAQSFEGSQISVSMIEAVVAARLGGEDGGHGHQEHEDRFDFLSSLPQYLSYDAVLILITFSVAILWNVVTIFYSKGTHTLLSMVVEILTLFAPLGLALFAICLWQKPLNCNNPRRSRSLLWVALILASTGFGNFQYREDCEVSGPLPGCCNYPGLPDFNKAEERREMCNVDERCEKAYPPEVQLVPNVTEVFCLMKSSSEDADPDDPDEGPEKGKAQGTGLLHLARRLLGYGPLEHEDKECEELYERWKAYRAQGWNSLEIEEETDKLSTAYKVLSNIGSAGSTEFYFTAIGVILKLIVIAEHPRSVEIFGSHGHHGNHGHDGHGEGHGHDERHGSPAGAVHGGSHGSAAGPGCSFAAAEAAEGGLAAAVHG